MLAYGWQKPACAHFVAGIFLKVPAEQFIHFIRKLLKNSFSVKQSHRTLKLLWRMRKQTSATKAQAQLHPLPEGLADASGPVTKEHAL